MADDSMFGAYPRDDMGHLEVPHKLMNLNIDPWSGTAADPDLPHYFSGEIADRLI
jgi:hypothetical protein